jgi:hypothetical protein
MNTESLRARLLAAARAKPPSDDVPYAFEKRIMARLVGGTQPDRLSYWSIVLWRAAASCVAFMLVVSAWTYFSASPQLGSDSFVMAFEDVVMAPLDLDETF